MMDNLYQFRISCKSKKVQTAKEQWYCLNSRDQRLLIIYKKVKKEKNLLKISLIFQDKF